MGFIVNSLYVNLAGHIQITTISKDYRELPRQNQFGWVFEFNQSN